MPEKPKIFQEVGNGKSIELHTSNNPFLNVDKEKFPDVDFTPAEGSFKERFTALNQVVDKAIGEGKNGHTSLSGISIWCEIYGEDVVQAIINSGRVGF